MPRRFAHAAFAVGLFVACSPESIAQPSPDAVPDPPVPLFASDEPLDIEIATDLRAVLRDRGEDASYHSATITHVSDGGRTEFDARVRVRGNFRSKTWNCGFPPLRLNFSDDVVGTVFAGQNKLKLVTHCQTGRDDYQQQVLQEYLVYRAFNLFTDLSFRVRLFNVTYVDTSGKMDPLQTFAFVIEDDDRMAERHSARIIKTGAMKFSMTNKEQAILVGLYQYMMGNTDWSVPGRHNIKVLAIGGHPGVFVVPYDFDHAGVVEAEYAKPNEKLNIETVRDRLFMGPCLPLEELQPVIVRMHAKREALLELYTNQTGLSDRARRRAGAFIESFFEVTSSPRKARHDLVRACIEEPHMR